MTRRFRTNRKWVRYAGHRWRLVADRGTWLFISRRAGEYGQWIPADCACS